VFAIVGVTPIRSTLVAFGSKFSKPFCEWVLKSLALLLSCNFRPSETPALPVPEPVFLRMVPCEAVFFPDRVLSGLELFLSSRWIESIVARTPSGISYM